MIDIKEVGITYTVYPKGEKKKDKQKYIYVVFLDTFLELIGEFDAEKHVDYSSYLSMALQDLKGFVQSPYAITWYARPRSLSSMQEAMEIALMEDNKFIVVEYLPED